MKPGIERFVFRLTLLAVVALLLLALHGVYYSYHAPASVTPPQHAQPRTVAAIQG